MMGTRITVRPKRWWIRKDRRCAKATEDILNAALARGDMQAVFDEMARVLPGLPLPTTPAPAGLGATANGAADQTEVPRGEA